MALRIARYIRGVSGLIRYRKIIGVHHSARVDRQGEFLFGRGVSIGRNTIVQIPPDGSLILGHGVYVGREIEISPDPKIRIGDFTTLQDRCSLLGDVVIGSSCLFAPNVFVSSGAHHFDVMPNWLIRDQDRLVLSGQQQAAVHSLPVRIHDDCWIGINAVIMQGVSIGRGCIVGANSVVTKSLPPYTIAAGMPARKIGERLKFEPPRQISASNPDDLPYFYSGFDLRQDAKRRIQGALDARGEFELALDLKGARALLLSVDAPRELTLQFHTQANSLARGPGRVRFEVDGAMTDFARLFIADAAFGSPGDISILSAQVDV